jgi:hypothetical protein
MAQEGLAGTEDNLCYPPEAGAEQVPPAGAAAILCRWLTPQLGFWLHQSPGDMDANPMQRCACFPSASLLSLPKLPGMGMAKGHTFLCVPHRAWHMSSRMQLGCTRQEPGPPAGP